ncbi:sphingosine kinase 2 [Lucilia sericata]|uniref:sphingosine kinase 2 n=1 Tax=Lucilia sericata TaxID=13632 RepID=UPI0018A83D0A|nr:sphingosine kinase 2 [Lucilia sericata]
MQRISVKIENDSEKSDVCSISNELRDTFYSNSKKGNVFHVRLNSNGLLLQRDTSSGGHKDHLVNICDIIGGRCVWIQKSASFGAAGTCGSCTPSIAEKHKNRDENEDAYLYVFAYMLKKNLRNAVRRERTVITLRFRSFDSHEDNMREAERWYKTLKNHRNNHLLLSNPRGKELCGKTAKSIETKRLLILLNPKSGSGKARQLFNHQVIPILNEAEVPYDLHVTKHSNYAFDFVRQKNLSIWSGIVAIGGDGLFHEVLNGILKRSDWNEVVQTLALGIVPCGSGNGLARSIAHCYREPYEPKPIIGAALSLVGGQSSLMDVVEIEMNNRIAYSFLSIGWGLISDIDIESERLRPLGYQRFTIWTLHRLINLRTYRGRISYLPKNCSSDQNTPETISKISLQHSMSCNTLPPPCPLRKQSLSNDGSVDFEDVISLETVANQSFRSRCNSILSSGSRVSTYYSIAESVYHSISGNSDCCESNQHDEGGQSDYRGNRLGQLEDKTLPALQDPLPSTWIVEDGEFVMIHAVYQTHLGSDCFFSPHSKLNDGTIYLVMIRGGISRSQLFNFLINMSSGTHLPNQNTEYILVERVVAFRLEPHENSGILTVDGERMECGSLQARIFPGTINVMVPNKVAFKDC